MFEKACWIFLVSGSTVNCQLSEAHSPVSGEQEVTAYVQFLSVSLGKPSASCCSGLIHLLSATLKSWRVEGVFCGLLSLRSVYSKPQEFPRILSGAVIQEIRYLNSDVYVRRLLIHIFGKAVLQINTNFGFIKNILENILKDIFSYFMFSLRAKASVSSLNLI